MTRSDSNEKTPVGQSWQTKPPAPSTRNENESNNEKTDLGTPARAAIIENARRFLQEDEVRNASIDKQMAFLKGKGLQVHEIQEILGIALNPEHESTIKTAQSATTSSPSTPLSQIPRELPPIITYPEFLTTPPQPAPIITARRLLTTLYLFSGLSASLYGTSNYLIVPMIESLTASRHTLAETAQVNLDKLITKLKNIASETPPSFLNQIPKHHNDGHDSGEESDSDPTEMFHRDIGVQTSPPVSRPSSPSQPLSAISEQATGLARLKTHLSTLTDASTSEGQDTADLTITIGLLRDYLSSLAYVPSASYVYAGAGIYGSGVAGTVLGSGQKRFEQNDEIANLKATIRSVKGVLLSAKSFPAGASVTTGIGRVR